MVVCARVRCVEYDDLCNCKDMCMKELALNPLEATAF